MGVLDDITKDRKRVIVAVLLIILLAAVLRFYHIDWSFSNNGIDEGIMLERALMVDHGYKLYSQLPCDQPPLAFYLGALLGGQVVPLRMVVAGMSIAAVVACMICSRKLGSSGSMLLTGLIMSVDFVFLRESRLFSLDAICACFIAFSIPAFAHYVRKNSLPALAVGGLFAGLATASKLLGGLAVLAMLLFMILEWRRDKKSLAKLAIDSTTMIVAAVIPILLFMVYLGPREVFDGMVLQQGGRGFDAFLKLSIIAFFGLSVAYVLPLVNARVLWKMSKETRYLLTLTAVMLAFMIIQPLIFLHHLAILSPPLAILSGIVLAGMLSDNKSESRDGELTRLFNKRPSYGNIAIAFLAATVIISAGLANYGLSAQAEPLQRTYGDWLARTTSADDFVVSGDPIIPAYAQRMTPPEIVNVAYRQHDNLTLDKLIEAIETYNVSVVIVCYRLNDIDGLTSYLSGSGFMKVVIPGLSGAEASLDLFQESIEPVVAYVRSA